MKLKLTPKMKNALSLDKETLKVNSVGSGIRAGIDSQACSPSQGAWHCPTVGHCLTL